MQPPHAVDAVHATLSALLAALNTVSCKPPAQAACSLSCFYHTLVQAAHKLTSSAVDCCLVLAAAPQPHGTAVKATQRPIFPCSKKNTDTIDRQEARDRREFNATAHKYRNLVPHAYHHHHKVSSNGRHACHIPAEWQPLPHAGQQQGQQGGIAVVLVDLQQGQLQQKCRMLHTLVHPTVVVLLH